MVIFGPKNIFELSLIELAGRTTDLFKLYKSGLILVETGPSISKCRKITTKSNLSEPHYFSMKGRARTCDNQKVNSRAVLRIRKKIEKDFLNAYVGVVERR